MKAKVFLVLAMALMIGTPGFAAVYGDLDHSGKVELKDAVLAIQTAAGMEPVGAFASGDVDYDSRIGLPEALFAWQSVAMLRAGSPEFLGLAAASVSNSDAVFLAWYPASDDDTEPGSIAYNVYYSTQPNFEPSADNLFKTLIGTTELTVHP